MYGVIYVKDCIITTKHFKNLKERVAWVSKFVKKHGAEGDDHYILYFIDGKILRPKFSLQVREG